MRSPVRSSSLFTGRSRAVRRAAFLFLSGVSFAVAPPAVALAQSAPVQRSSPNDSYAALIADAAQRFGLPAAWVRAVLSAESAGDARALSPKGAMGLMQIMPETWAALHDRLRLGDDPFDPRDNILAGAAYLRDLHDRYGAPGFLAAYNAGPARYEEFLAGRPLPSETRAYLAALGPLLDGRDGSIGAVTTNPLSWTNAPLFIVRADRTAAADPVQTGHRPDGAPAVRPERDLSAILPQSDGLFVARSGPKMSR
jgi:membrane-bound lytic murein transglycosylase B